MLICMRTTLHLPDDLYRAVKQTAAVGGQTMTSFVEEALRDALRRHRQGDVADVPLPPAVGTGGLLPGVDLADSAGLLDLLDGR